MQGISKAYIKNTVKGEFTSYVKVVQICAANSKSSIYRFPLQSCQKRINQPLIIDNLLGFL